MNTDAMTHDELGRIHACATTSDFEDSIKSQIMIWGYENNMLRLADGLSPAKYETFELLAQAYWKDYIGC